MKKSLYLFRSLCVGFFLAGSTLLSGQVSNPNADASIKAFNDAFLITSGGRTYYKKALNDANYDGTWTLALDIFGMQDVYERTGSAVHKALVNSLCNSFLLFNPTPYSWDGWNDDLAWMGLGLARGYQITGTTNLLTQAENCFNLAYNRGWNTVFNNGGIWEQQPDMTPPDGGINKEALSNNPNGKLACLLYESTGKIDYKNKAIQIYNWSRSHIFNPATGQVYTNVDRNNAVNKGTAVYNQGSFIDFAAVLYKITGDETILRDAQMAADYVLKNMTINGIISNSAGYLNTWADEYARGLGHLCMWNPQLWNTYYPFLKKNADAAWANRRTDLNLSWNGWTEMTPIDAAAGPTKYVSTVAIEQFTPTVQSIPDTIEAENYNFMNGIRIENNLTGGKNIGSIDAGDWVEYIIHVPTTSTYTTTCYVSGISAGSMQVLQNNVTLSTIDLPGTGDLQTYTPVHFPLKLTAGIQSIKFKAIVGGWNMDKWIAQSCQYIVPSISVNDAAPQQVTSAVLQIGDKIAFHPQPFDGSWGWTGPNGFTSNSSQVTISNIQLNQGGVYTATYTSPEGCISVQDFMVSLNGCTPDPIVPFVQLNGGELQQLNSVSLDAGNSLTIDPQPQDGNWSWTGPNGFRSTSRKISFLSVAYKQAGNYTATYANPSGCTSTQVIAIALTGSDPYADPIVPYVSVNGGAWQQTGYVGLNIGGKLTVGPQPTNGSWSWTGPGGFTSKTREFTLSNFNATQAGTYSATYTNSSGSVSKGDFIIGVRNCTSTSIIPDIQVNGMEWLKVDSIVLSSGGRISFNPPASDGIWSWTGPNGFTSSSRQITFNNILKRQAGNYTATFINTGGCESTYEVNIDVTGDDYCGTPIVPYVNINGLSWQKGTSASLKTGGSLNVGPQSAVNGTWVWTGPEGFSSNSREFTLSNITVAQAGTYSATFTNSSGCESYVNFKVTVDGVSGLRDALEDNPGVQLYPNPSTDTVTLRNVPVNTTITILDLSGRELLRMKSSNVREDVSVNVSSLTAGVYCVKLENKGIKMLKLVKK